jgi:molybdenum-dependent DNA-binding transcriptional regulator ModE
MKFSLTERAASEGTTPLALVIEAVKRGGSQSAASRLLGVSHTAIRYHLNRAGLTVRTATVAMIEGGK